MQFECADIPQTSIYSVLLIQNDLVMDPYLDLLYLLPSYGKISKVNDSKQVFLVFIFCFKAKK